MACPTEQLARSAVEIGRDVRGCGADVVMPSTTTSGGRDTRCGWRWAMARAGAGLCLGPVFAGTGCQPQSTRSFAADTNSSAPIPFWPCGLRDGDALPGEVDLLDIVKAAFYFRWSKRVVVKGESPVARLCLRATGDPHFRTHSPSGATSRSTQTGDQSHTEAA